MVNRTTYPGSRARHSLGFIVVVSALLGGPAVSQDDIMHNRDLWSFERSEAVALRVDVGRTSAFTIDRRIYGNFLEHLGRCIYGGVWAQILQNPGLEQLEVPQRWHGAAVAPGLDPADYAQHLPVFWEPLQAELAPHAHDADAASNKWAQRITLDAAQQRGLKQTIHLPVHRVGDYVGAVYLRAERPTSVIARLRAGEGGAATEVELRAGPEWQQARFEIAAPEGVKSPGQQVVFELAATGEGVLWLDLVELFAADHVEGMDPDIIRLGREWRVPLLRWPGGNFASGYHWREGVGPRADRPTIKNPAWGGFEYHHFGTDEFMRFCELIECEPYITVNIGNGTPEEAAAWVEYCNGPADTEMGRLRAENGHPEPYGVHHWEIGNEIYGEWQIGHCDAGENARRYEAFVAAMRAVDPSIEVIANGHVDHGWNQALLDECGPRLQHMALHPLVGFPWSMPHDRSERDIYLGVMAHPLHFERDFLPAMRERIQRSEQTPDSVAAAITEWGLIEGGRDQHGRVGTDFPHAVNLAGALYAGTFLNTLLRSADFVKIAHITGFLHGGGLKKRLEVAYADPYYYVQQMYATQSGTRLCRLELSGPAYDFDGGVAGVPEIRDVPWLDAVACVDGEGAEVTILATNRDPGRSWETTLSFEGFAPRHGEALVLTGPDLRGLNSWDRPEAITPARQPLEAVGAEMTFAFPAQSVTRLVLAR